MSGENESGAQEGNEDAGLLEDLKAQGQEPEGEEGGQEPTQEEGKETEPKVDAEPKMFTEDYVKKLRTSEARTRVKLRQAEAQLSNRGPQIDPSTGQPVTPQVGSEGAYRDPRVDGLIAEQTDAKLSSKLSEIKADPDFSEIYDEVDEEGVPFEARLLEKAKELQWPIEQLDALALKMSRSKIFGKIKQRGIDEAYKSQSAKANGSAEKNVSSGKNVEAGEVDSIEDAINKTMKEKGITDLSNLG